jgi:hypothetical protein
MLPRRPLTLFAAPVFLATLVACTTRSTDDAESGTGAVHTAAGVCMTLDYGHTASVGDFYRKFDSPAAAADFMTKVIARGQLAGPSGPDAKLKEISQDPRLVGLVNEVFDGFKKAFPKETNGMTDPPRIAIVETAIPNAFAMGPGFVDADDAPTDKAPWLFVVHTALLSLPLTDDALRGLFAHELGHLILRNILPETRRRIRADYVVTGSEDGIIGSDQDSDGRVQAHVEQLLKLRDRVGGIPELGFPTIQSDAVYARVFGQLVGQVVQASADPMKACPAVATKTDALKAAQQALVPGIAGGNLAPRTPSADEQANLDRLSDDVATEVRSCLAALPDDAKNSKISDLIADANGMHGATDPASADHQKLLDLMLPEELAVDADPSKTTFVDRLLAAQAVIRNDLISLTQDPAFPIDELRVFDFEEDADDASVRVLAALGKDPHDASATLLAFLPDDLRAQCLADVAAHKPIPYGRFIDPHPAICWRHYHVAQLATALAQCSAPAATEKTRVGGGASSVTDKPPTDLVEKGYGRR